MLSRPPLAVVRPWPKVTARWGPRAAYVLPTTRRAHSPAQPYSRPVNSRAYQFVVHDARCAAGPVVAITLPDVAEAPMLDLSDGRTV